MVSKITNLSIGQGHKMRLETPGGGGFGDPLTRHPERVARDVRLGYVTQASARNDYGVVVDEDGAIDALATAGLRSGAGR